MKRLSIICLFLLAWAGTLFAQTLKSPDGNLTLQFRLSAEGTPVYSLQYKGKEVIKESKLGFSVRPDYQFDRNFTITDTQTSESNTTWKPVWGQYNEIRDHHNELFVAMKQNGTGWLLPPVR